METNIAELLLMQNVLMEQHYIAGFETITILLDSKYSAGIVTWESILTVEYVHTKQRHNYGPHSKLFLVEGEAL